ncbi:MAG: APC family permease [Rubrobacteraceae bacterium]
MSTQVSNTDSPHLRRELHLWEAVGISLALMAPSMAANINPQGTATTIGRAVPLAFALATIGVLLIAWTFVRLTQRFNHAGSVYGFVGATLGARAGVISGWALMGTYTFYGVVTSTAAGIFGADFLNALGIWTNQPEWAPFLVGAIALAGVWALAAANIREGTRVLLVIEGTTVALILIVSVVILIKLATGTAPNGNTLDFSVFSVPAGTGTSAVFLGVVFGFLSFAGFEAAATLGEEAQEPRRDIPRAILSVAIFGGLYFIFVTAIEVMGFGTDAKGVESFIASGSLLGDLGSQFVAGWVGELITIGAAVSAFGCALACIVGASRLLFALSRDEVGPAPLGVVSPRTGVPARSTAAIVICAYAIMTLAWVALGVAPFDLFVASGTIGTLILLLVYALATIGAARLFFFSGERRIAAWEIVVPFLALVVIGYTLFRNVYPYPTEAARWYPIIAAAWVVAGVLVTFVRYAATQRVGERLLAEEGLATRPRTEG